MFLRFLRRAGGCLRHCGFGKAEFGERGPRGLTPLFPPVMA